MSDKADLKRIKADLEEAQAEIETASKIDDSLGGSLSFRFRSLLAAVGQLFTRTNDHESKISKHDPSAHTCARARERPPARRAYGPARACRETQDSRP
jgi:hypothetical protein